LFGSKKLAQASSRKVSPNRVANLFRGDKTYLVCFLALKKADKSVGVKTFALLKKSVKSLRILHTRKNHFAIIGLRRAKPLATFSSSAVDQLPAAFRRHTNAKAVRIDALSL
jgi:hypothetical protein